MEATFEVPRNVRAFGRLWASKFILAHPNWKNGEVYEDAFRQFGDYDLNLWCEDGQLSVCAYPIRTTEDGTQADYSKFTYIVRKTQGED